MARTLARKSAARKRQPAADIIGCDDDAERGRQPCLAGGARHSGGAAPAVPVACRGHRGVRDDRRSGRGQGMLGRYRAQVGAWPGEARCRDPRGGRRDLGADGRHHPQARCAVRWRHHRGDGGGPARDHDRRASRSRVRPGGGGRRRRKICRDFSRYRAAAPAIFEGRCEGGARSIADCAAISRAFAASRRWMSTRSATP